MQDLLESFILSENVPKNIVHNTELLLKLYRKVAFAVKCHLKEIDEELYITERKQLSDFVHELINCDLNKERRRLQDRLTYVYLFKFMSLRIDGRRSSDLEILS